MCVCVCVCVCVCEWGEDSRSNVSVCAFVYYRASQIPAVYLQGCCYRPKEISFENSRTALTIILCIIAF